MPRRTRIPLAALAAACVGEGPVAATPAALVGSWRTPAESLQPQGTWRTTLVVHPDMRVERRGITYGLYPNDGPQTISASSTLYGRLGATASSFVIHPDSVVTEDRFYGPGHHEVQRDFSWWPSDSTTYVVKGDVLSLTYFSYPADAPVVTHAVYHRVR